MFIRYMSRSTDRQLVADIKQKTESIETLNPSSKKSKQNKSLDNKRILRFSLKNMDSTKG